MSDTNTTETKTPEQIEALKQSWMHDPIWDIEDTQGFEAHADELKKFADEHKAKMDAEWTAKEPERRARAIFYKGKEPISALYALNEYNHLDLTDEHGITKREFFAAMAMQGAMARFNYIAPEFDAEMFESNVAAIADYSLAAADALIERLCK